MYSLITDTIILQYDSILIKHINLVTGTVFTVRLCLLRFLLVPLNTMTIYLTH